MPLRGSQLVRECMRETSMASWGKRTMRELAGTCWQCNARLPKEGVMCPRCGAARAMQEALPNLASPQNGWVTPPDMFDVPKRYRNRQAAEVTDEATATATPAEDTKVEHVYTPPIFDVEVYQAAPPARTYEPRIVNDEPGYMPPIEVYDLFGYSSHENDLLALD